MSSLGSGPECLVRKAETGSHATVWRFKNLGLSGSGLRQGQEAPHAEGQGLLATGCVLATGYVLCFTWKDAASSALRPWWHSLSRDPKAKVHV